MSAVSSKFEAHLTAHSLIDRGRKSIVMPPKIGETPVSGIQAATASCDDSSSAGFAATLCWVQALSSACTPILRWSH